MENPGFNFGKLRKFNEVTTKASFTPEERRRLFEKAQQAGSIGEKTLDNPSSLLDSFSKEKMTGFMRLISSENQISEKDLVYIGNALREYGTRSNQEKKLSPEDQKLITILIDYLEDWFYKGGIVKMTDTVEKNRLQDDKDLGGAAFVVNQLAKIKEVPEYQESIKGFDINKLSGFIDEVIKNIPKFFSLEAIEQEEREAKNITRELENNWNVSKAKAERYLNRMKSLEDKFIESINTSITTIESNLDLLPDDYFRERRDLVEFCKDVKKFITRESLRYLGTSVANDVFDAKYSEYTVREDAREKASDIYEKYKEQRIPPGTKRKSYQEFVKEEEDKTYATMAQEKKSLDRIMIFLKGKVGSTEKSGSKPQKFSGFDALKNLAPQMESTDYQVLDSALKTLVTNKFGKDTLELKEISSKPEVEDFNKASSALRRERDRFIDKKQREHNKYSFKEIMDDLEFSKKSIIGSLKNDKNGTAGLYFLKSYLVAAAELRKSKRLGDGHKDHVFDPDLRINNEFSQGKPVYSFGNIGMYGNIHYEPRHILFIKFALEYQWQKEHHPELFEN